mmetsp:Transcript_76579/g.94026  ORF Transcript_76579/g.94026 Transcript_76579/m.94026 type:complete len:438 (+) Transcript_76579:16-1329(+)
MFEIMLKLVCLISFLIVNNVLCADPMYFQGDNGQIVEASPDDVIERLDPDTKTFLDKTEKRLGIGGADNECKAARDECNSLADTLTEDLKTFEKGGLARVIHESKSGDNNNIMDAEEQTIVRITDDRCFNQKMEPIDGLKVKDLNAKLANSGNIVCYIGCIKVGDSQDNKFKLISYKKLSNECGYSTSFPRRNPFVMEFIDRSNKIPFPLEIYPYPSQGSKFKSIVSTCFVGVQKLPTEGKIFRWVLMKQIRKQDNEYTIEPINEISKNNIFFGSGIKIKSVMLDPTCYVFGETINENPIRAGFVPCYEYCNLDDDLSYHEIFTRIRDSMKTSLNSLQKFSKDELSKIEPNSVIGEGYNTIQDNKCYVLNVGNTNQLISVSDLTINENLPLKITFKKKEVGYIWLNCMVESTDKKISGFVFQEGTDDKKKSIFKRMN